MSIALFYKRAGLEAWTNVLLKSNSHSFIAALWKRARQVQRILNDEDNEIEIVEPKSDIINLDSDNDEDTALPRTDTKDQLNKVANATFFLFLSFQFNFTFFASKYSIVFSK